MSHREMARLQGGSGQDLKEGEEQNVLKKKIFFFFKKKYVCGSGDREFCKVSFTYWGNEFQRSESTGCRHKDRQVHVQRAEMEQALTRAQLGLALLPWNGSCGKSPLCPLKEWHHLNFLSQKQVLLGAVELMLPGFL